MKTPCEPCRGTGLTFPLCDSDCTACGGTGLVQKEKPKERPRPLRVSRKQQLINTLCDIEDCSDWEAGFIDSITKQFEARGTLTDNQVIKAEEILKRYR